MTIPNGLTMPQLEQIAQDLGTECGRGKDTQIKFLLKITEAAFHGAIDLVPMKHGKVADDAEHLAEIYVKAQSGATHFDAKAANQRKTISCMRTCIRLGMWPKGGPAEPMTTVNNLMAERGRMKANPIQAKVLDDAANTLLRFARAQLKSDTLIDNAELGDFCRKPPAQMATAQGILEGVETTLKNLIAGKSSHGTAMDDSPAVKQALRSIKARLDDIKKPAPVKAVAWCTATQKVLTR